MSTADNATLPITTHRQTFFRIHRKSLTTNYILPAESDMSNEHENAFSANNISLRLNSKDARDFFERCSLFMDVTKEGFELMFGIISDSVIDTANPNTDAHEIIAQLKLLRELNFLVKNMY